MNIDNLIVGNNTASKRRGNKPKNAIANATLASSRNQKRPRMDIGKSNNQNSNNNQNEEELLALALGSSLAGGTSSEHILHDADRYEESVIRNAELAATPRLMTNMNHNLPINNNNNSIPFGFPALRGLTRQRSVHENLGHARNLLANLRKSNAKGGLLVNTKDCLKEQMLLHLMHSTSNDFEMGVFPQQEAKQEWKRRKLYRDQTIDTTNNNDTNTSSTTNTNNKQKSKQRHQELAATAPLNDNSNRSNETPEGRLEGIKKGASQKSVRFAGLPTSSSNSSTTTFKSLLTKKVVKNPSKKRRRISMQERKRREDGGDTRGEFNNDDNEEEEECSRDEIVKQLKEIRNEREARRRQRKKAWSEPQNDESSEEEFEFTGNEEEEEITVKNEPPSLSEPADTILPDAVESSTLAHDESRSTEAADDHHDATNETDNALICPLCDEEIHVPEMTLIKTEDGHAENDDLIKSHRDAVLAQHMSVCQTQRRSGRRRQNHRRGSSASNARIKTEQSIRECTRGASRPIYAESEDEIEFSPEDDEYHEEFRQDIDIKLEDGFDEDDFMTDDIAMDEDDNEIVTGKPVKSNSRPRRSSRTKSTPNSHRAPAKLRSRHPPPPLDDWYEDDYEDRVDDWIQHGLERMPMMNERDLNEIPPGEEEYDGGLIVPAWVNDRLFSYQRTGLQWMWELHRQQVGGILGDEMGLGKTIQVASFLGSMAASRKVKSILIISPATMLQHWLKEMAVWAPGVRRILIHQSGDAPMSQPYLLHNTMGQRKITPQLLHEASQWLKTSRRNRLFEIIDESDLETRDPSSFCGTAYAFVTTFENVRRNDEIWTNHRWSYVVIDEAQKIRNPTADVTLVCKRLKTPHRLALSGTPIQNDLRELWSIIDFVFPGRLGTLPAFETEFGVPIKRGGYSNASPLQVQLAYRCALLLKDLINPYLLRRLKKDIKEVQRMPGKKEQVLFCRLSDQQRSVYEAFLRSDYVKKVFSGSAQLLGAITVMRKICNHLDLVSNPEDGSMEPFLQNDLWYPSEVPKRVSDGETDDSGKEDDNGTTEEDRLMIQKSGKLEILAKILPLWKKHGHRVLIFCQWKKMLDIIMRFVVSKGWKFSRLDGNTNVASRQRLVDTFNSDESYFGMLCTTRTGGVGLNLTGADRIILYDPDWNPQTDAQARERAWRFGQKREVTVFRMICAGTVEEKIYQRQIFKTAISNSVLHNTKQRRLFTNKDLKDLFSLKADNGSIVSGSEGVTETAQLTNGNGYVDPDDEVATSSNLEDDGETMRTVLKSQGLAGIFDHDVVEGKTKDKKASVREMEARAKRIARDALRNLQQSVKQDEQDNAYVGSRFGDSRGQSNSLLSSIAERNAEISNATSTSRSEEIKQHTQLLKKLYRFVRSTSPTTDQILNEFSSQTSTLDASVFRRLLKSIATLRNGKWTLK